jgi:hypothetical protein
VKELVIIVKRSSGQLAGLAVGVSSAACKYFV